MGNRALPQLGQVVAAWALFAFCALWLTRQGFTLDTDSALRLVQVRDLLGGQGWLDTTQWRMNTPHGLSMHWSRVVDGPLALLMLASERFALTAWPLLLFLAALLLLARIASALGGRTAVPVVLGLALLCTEIHGLFLPGAIDHHNLQIVLMLAALLSLVTRRPHLAACAVALGLGVGIESLPYAALACAAAAVWLRDDATVARAFGITLSGAALALLLVTTAAAWRTAPVCDTYSLFHAVLLLAGGAGLAGISFLKRHRLVALAALAIGLLALAALLNPACLAGPYGGMDGRLQAIFLSRINEARPVWDFARFAPNQFVGGYLYAAFALALCFCAAPGRARSLVMAFAALALVVGTFQIRAVPFAILFALPGLAAGLARLLQRRSIVWLAMAVLAGNSAAFALAGAIWEGPDKVARRVAAFQAQKDCAGDSAMRLLSALPPGRVAAFVDQGPAILAATPDLVIAGPYHRNGAGILDTYAIFAGGAPQDILRARGIAYVMTCKAAPDWDYYRAQGPQGLVSQLAQGRVPDWLVPLGRSGAVALYRVR